MTGGQPIELLMSPMDMVQQLLSEGVRPVRLVSDQPEQYEHLTLPEHCTLHHRDELDVIQRELRQTPGVTGIVYEQTCATEKRRRRKRGLMDDPHKRLFINSDVCEGCGDCSVQSNCISIQPLETEFGRKREINQSTCNKDYSCEKGFCPSFVTVTGGAIAVQAGVGTDRLEQWVAKLPEPPVAPLAASGYNILVAGIGGTGVLTIGALLGMAAHLENKGCTILDLTGMAQKGGSVTSHIRIGPDPEGIYSSRLSEGMADVIIACDLIVASGAPVLKTVRPGHTAAVLNTDVAPTGAFQSNKHLDLGEVRLRKAILDALDGGTAFDVQATQLATELTGDSIGTNVFMLGYAAQQGLLPLSVTAIEEAIRLNGTFVSGNLRTFALGRLAAHDATALAAELTPTTELPPLDTVAAVVASRQRLLTDYQDSQYAREFTDFIDEVQAAVAALPLAQGETLVREVALTLGRLMAYKDEYEVARLYTQPEFMARIKAQFAGDFKLSFNLAPPMLMGKDLSGRPKKREFGPWILTVFKVLTRLKGLRGTALDPFGYTHERRMERRLISDYRELIRELPAKLNPDNETAALALARAAGDISGYGPVKEVAVARYESALPDLIRAFESPVNSHAEVQYVEVQQISQPEKRSIEGG
jgi:indolepyruvate ferredoxin oxidoreductase